MNFNNINLLPCGFRYLGFLFVHLGIKESDTGLAPPALWDLAADKQTLQGEQPFTGDLIANINLNTSHEIDVMYS